MRFAALALVLCGCYAPEQPICTYRCDTSVGNNSACPWDYECRQDGYCHLQRSVGDCPFPSLDMGAPVPADMSMPPKMDLATGPDLRASFDLTMAQCNDKTKNGDETDVDCGGTTCPACADTKSCVLPRDCVSLVCGMNATCLQPSCTDGVKNGSETDIDCGGGTPCGPCAGGKKCAANTDCISMVCAQTVCTAPADMSIGPDLSTPPDFAMPPPDLAVPPDLTTPPDLTMPPDLLPPG